MSILIFIIVTSYKSLRIFTLVCRSILSVEKKEINEIVQVVFRIFRVSFIIVFDLLLLLNFNFLFSN